MSINKISIFLIFYLLIGLEVQAALHEEDLEAISRSFHLENPLFLQPLPGGIANSPFYVFTKKNEEEIPFGVFKNETKNKEFVTQRLMFLEEIKNHGFQNLPKVIKNINGNYLTNINEKNYSCIEYLIPDLQEKKISFSLMLELIGQFHAASKDLPNGSILIDRVLDAFKKRKRFFSDQQLKEADPNLFNTPLWERLISLSDFYATPEFEKIYNALPSQIIHGDLHVGNVVKSRNKFYFIDFDLMRYDIRLWDLVCCISFSFFDEFIEKTKDGNFHSFIESHYEFNNIKLDPYEKHFLYEIVTFREVDVISWFLEMMYYGIINQNETQFKQFRNFLLRHMTHIEQLQACHSCFE